MKLKLNVGIAPHIHSSETIPKVMVDVMIALVPATIAALYFFGLKAFLLIVISIVTCMLSEYLWTRDIKKIYDMSAVVTGFLFALTLPPTLPWWMAVVGSVFAIIIGKQVFGGLGHNAFNPALAGRAFLQISWPQDMTSWVKPFDAITTATPLANAKLEAAVELPSYLQLLVGNHAGSLGETSALALIIGGLFLIYKKHIFAIVPFVYIAVVGFGAFLLGADPLFHILSGGLMLGAFFMATDPVTSPVSRKGKYIFAFFTGLLTILIRLKGGFPEGVCFSILIMNMFVPLIDYVCIPKKFGARGENGGKKS